MCQPSNIRVICLVLIIALLSRLVTFSLRCPFKNKMKLNSPFDRLKTRAFLRRIRSLEESSLVKTSTPERTVQSVR